MTGSTSHSADRNEMQLFEFRIPMPFSTEEYQVGQMYSVAEMSLRATGGGEGVEVLQNQPFADLPMRLPQYDRGQFTYKIYRMESKVPGFIRLLTEPGKFDVHEEAWNAFPYCRTKLSNPGYMKENFSIDIESIHIDNNIGDTENALHLPDEELKIRKIVYIDIGNDEYTGKADMIYDPSKFKSTKTGRGPLFGDWIRKTRPIMTAYKVVRVEFKWFGLQRKVENVVQMNEHRLFTQFHRQMFCWSDTWYGMSLDDVRQMEVDSYDKLKSKMQDPESNSTFAPTDLYESKSNYVINK